MTAIRSHHGRMFTQLVAEHRQKLADALVTGVDEKLYWRLVGEIQGLDAALKLSEQADFKLSGDEPDAGA
jgi:L-amino acid N-acyltransferase YncA